MQPFSLSPPRAPARLLVLLLLVLAGLLGAARAVHAQSRIYVNDNATGLNTGADWLNAYTDLQSALGVAGSGDEIWVAAGEYKPGPCVCATFQLENGVAVYGGFAGTETLRTQRNWTANVSLLNGGYMPDVFNFHVVYGYDVDATAVLDGFTITGGFANGPLDTCPDRCGGGIYLDASSPTLANLVITANQAKYGAGMANAFLSNPELKDVTFVSNTAVEGGWGGGMYNYESNPKLSGVIFSGNESDTGSGGGMYNYTSNPTLSGVIFSGNETYHDGGGMYNYTSNPTLSGVIFSGNETYHDGGGMYNHLSSPKLSGVIFSDNQAETSSGGGMYNYTSNPTLTNVTFSGNRAYYYGGGIYTIQNSNATLTNVTLSGNRANYGGAIANNASNPTLTNVTLSGNRANDGGGIYNKLSSPTLTNMTLSGNQAGSYGGGIYNEGSYPLIQNSIIWGNSATSGATIYQIGGTTTLRYSLIQGGVPSGSTDGGNNLSGDPLFVRAVNCRVDGCTIDPTNDDYGDLRLQPSSPALDVGDNGADLNGNSVGNSTIATIDFDVDGAPRLAAVKRLTATVDLGAYERANTSPTAQAGGPYTANEGDTIALNGAASSDEVGITSYAWDCTNNGTVEATSPNFTGNSCLYPDDGAFTLSLTVTDVAGLPGSATAAVTIANVVPTLTVPPNQSTFATSAKLFDLGSFTDPGAEGSWSVTVDWGDNSALTQFTVNATGNLPAKSHTYAAAGTFSVVVKVNDDAADDDGGFQVTVNPLPPGAPNVTAPAGQTAMVGTEQAFSFGSFSDPGSSGPWQVTVDWGDGSSPTLFNANSGGDLGTRPHSYAAIGTYNVLVTVSDGDLAASASFQVSVAGGPVEAGSVAGQTFDDANGNGTQETGEAGIPGVQVTLSDGNESVSASLVRSTTTASDGSYRFDNVPAGDYTLTIEPPAIYEIVGANQHQIQVTAGNTTSGPNFNLRAINTADGGLHLPAILK